MPDKPQLDTLWEAVRSGAALAKTLGVSEDRLVTESGRVKAGQIWIEASIDQRWRAAARLVVQQGDVVVGEIRVFPRETRGGRAPGRWSADVLGARARVPRGGLTAQTLRAVRLGGHVTQARDVLAWIVKRHGRKLFAPGHSLGELGLLPPDQARPRRARNAGRPDRFYARLAATYAGLVSRGVRHPIKDMAKRRRVEPPTVRDWIREARVRGLLTTGTRGRASGQLTPFAQRVLKTPASGTTRSSR